MATTNMYGLLADYLMGGNTLNWPSDTIKLALVTSTYVPNQDTHDFFNDITNQLAGVNGYTTGGVSLTSKTKSYVSASNTEKMVAANASWTASGGNIGPFRYGICYKDTGTASTSPLLFYIDFITDQTITNTNIGTVIWDATDGVFDFTVT